MNGIDILEQKDMFGDVVKPNTTNILKSKCIMPPFSVLSARDGDWQSRKRQWMSLGIQSEIGRGQTEQSGNYRSDYGVYQPNFRQGRRDEVTGRLEKHYSRKEADRRSNVTSAPKKPEWATGTGTENMAPGTSIFDPVLCELMYSWFCPQGGQIIDPFAGGSVRGIVASVLGYRYWGCDLSRK